MFYKNDLLEGKKTCYYSNNKISEEGSYKNGKATVILSITTLTARCQMKDGM